MRAQPHIDINDISVEMKEKVTRRVSEKTAMKDVACRNSQLTPSNSNNSDNGSATRQR